MAAPRILVLGVGNTLMGDDGVGAHAVQAFAGRYELPANLRVIDGGVAGLGLLGEIAAVDYLLIVDAVRNGGLPGTIHRLRREEIAPRGGPLVSAHEVGVAELLAAAEFSGQLPVADIIGVEPLQTETMTLELSVPVRRAMPEIVAAIVDTLHAHGVELKEKSKVGTPCCGPEELDA
ncbi:MAG TPA: hydrogenase maturation protease [Candidatus Acidoferrales bacterium]|nr:hydrogenase maturation protease [Candidatus Acidoferrales bacterium]